MWVLTKKFCFGFSVIAGMILPSASQASSSPKERLLPEYEKVWDSTKSVKAHAQSLESGKSHNDVDEIGMYCSSLSVSSNKYRFKKYSYPFILAPPGVKVKNSLNGLNSQFYLKKGVYIYM